VLLHVSGMASGVSISKLDDSDIREEEIKDLKQKVMNGLLRQTTVVSCVYHKIWFSVYSLT
jgi:hypothetical protein